MKVLQLDNISLDFGSSFLFKNIDLKVEEQEVLFLVGRNGVGKSTFLKVIAKEVYPDSGVVFYADDIKVAYLPQELPKADNQTVFEVVSKGLDSLGKLLQTYYKLTHSELTEKELNQMDRLQKEIEEKNGWQYEQKIQSILSKLELNPDVQMSSLSGGWRRRVSIAQALVAEPDLLLLDEPTNHLDLENILWIEKHLSNFKGAIICISHDRAFVDKLATRIIELDRGNLYSYPGKLENYLKLKEKRLEDEKKANELFDKKLAEEEVWIRQGIKARRTRNEGRVRALKALRDEHAKREDLINKPSFDFKNSKLSSKLVIEANEISFSYKDKNIVKNFSTRILRGDRVGIIGPNGSGKSTLIKLLLKQLQPDSGTVKLGINVDVAYFDQLRNQLDENLSIIDNVAQGSESINVNGKEKHVISYLQDFLFTPEQSRRAVSNLSGGEKNRVLLAKLFSTPASLLILDEPTNDLDVETLELLEDILSNYTGTVILVSHDRTFMDNIVSEVFAFDGECLETHVGGYTDWINYKNKQVKKETKEAKEKKENSLQLEKKEQKNNKLTYKVKRELELLPKKIEELEEKMQNIQTLMSSSDFYQKSQEEIESTAKQLKEVEDELEKSYTRWSEIEDDLQN